MSATDEDRAELEAARAASKKLSGGNWNPHLNLPPGVELLKVGEAGERMFNFFSYLKKTAGGVFEVGKRAAFREYSVHTVGPNRIKALCPYETFGEPCTMCQKKSEAFRTPGKDKKELAALAKPYYTSKRRMYNVADADKDPQKIMVFDFAVNCFADKLDAKLSSRSAETTMLGWNNPQHGKTLGVTFETSTTGTNPFREATNIEVLPRIGKYTSSIMNSIIDLDSLLVRVTDAELWAMFTNGEVDEEGDEEDAAPDGGLTNSQQVDEWAETAAVATKSKGKVAASVPADVEPDPEPEPDADTPEEEEEPPFEEPEPEPEPVKPVAKKAVAKSVATAATAKKAAPKKATTDDESWE